MGSSPSAASLAPGNLTAVILAGGKGERLRPITESVPKALVEVHGRPLLHHLVDFLRGWGVARFAICTGYKAELVENSMMAAFGGECDLRCVDSGDVPMTDRIIDAIGHATGPILICYGDTLANVDVARLVDFHSGGSFDATLSVYPLRSPFGVVTSDETGVVVEMAEKPQLPHWINIGFVVCEASALGRLERGNDLISFLDTVRAHGRLGAYRHTGRHVTVNTEKERNAVEAEKLEFLTVTEGPST